MKLINNGRLLISLIMLLSPLSWPNGYEVKMGQGYTLCEDIQRQLADLPEPEGMACNVQFDPKYQDLKRVEWKPMSIEDNLDLVEEMDKYSYRNHRSQVFKGKKNAELTKEEWVKDFAWRLKEYGSAELKRSHFDLNNDGDKEIVIGYQIPSTGYSGCLEFVKAGHTFHSASGYHLFVYNDNTKAINYKAADLLHGDAFSYNVFRYQGKHLLFVTHFTHVKKDIAIYVYELRDSMEPPRRSQRCKLTKRVMSNNKGE